MVFWNKLHGSILDRVQSQFPQVQRASRRGKDAYTVEITARRMVFPLVGLPDNLYHCKWRESTTKLKAMKRVWREF